MSGEREHFSPSELAIVLSHYDLGVIESAKEFPRGSRRSPKLLLQTEKGKFLLKRRAQGRDEPLRVAFAHALVEHVRGKQVPAAALLPTRHERGTVLRIEGHVYECFEFVEGERYDDSLEQTTHAGVTLAQYHEAVLDFHAEWMPPHASYHDAAMVRTGLNTIPTTTAGHDSVVGHEAELLETTQRLYELYDEASTRVEAEGFPGWPSTIIHGDWHPGNLLFFGQRVVAVLDFDAARFQPPVIDIAYGMLQFSILRGEDDPAQWPDFIDESRTRRFWTGFRSRGDVPIGQRRVIPDLMVEALIGEAALPIAITGSFGRLPGYGILQMIRRKVQWLLRNRQRLVQWLVE